MTKFALIVISVFVCCAGVYGQKAGGGAKPDPAKGVRDAFDRMIEGIRQVDADKVMSVRVELLSPTSAYVSFKWKQTQEADGKLESASGRTTLVFKKIGKDWKAVHVHVSPDVVPAERPVLDSERVKPAG